LFNRTNDPAAKTIDFQAELGLSDPAPARDLWAHRDLGTMTSWTVTLAPHACSLIKVTPTGAAIYQAEVGAWTGSARFENVASGRTGTGYVTGLDSPGAGVTVVVSAKKAGRHTLACRVANATGAVSTLTVTTSEPDSGHQIGKAALKVPSAKSWKTWRTVKVDVELGTGDTMVTLAHSATDRGSVNVDRLTLA
jgi:alpha-glucosidase